MAYNNPIQKKESACKQLKSETGKPSGLMMEGSLAHMESAIEMSPYKMDSALHNNDPYSRAAANDKVFADAKKEQYSRKNKKHAGANFFPPQNPRPKNELQKGKTASGPGGDIASRIYDVDQDGDSVFRDYNQDGTMLGRAIKKLIG